MRRLEIHSNEQAVSSSRHGHGARGNGNTNEIMPQDKFIETQHWHDEYAYSDHQQELKYTNQEVKSKLAGHDGKLRTGNETQTHEAAVSTFLNEVAGQRIEN